MASMTSVSSALQRQGQVFMKRARTGATPSVLMAVSLAFSSPAALCARLVIRTYASIRHRRKAFAQISKAQPMQDPLPGEAQGMPDADSRQKAAPSGEPGGRSERAFRAPARAPSFPAPARRTSRTAASALSRAGMQERHTASSCQGLRPISFRRRDCPEGVRLRKALRSRLSARRTGRKPKTPLSNICPRAARAVRPWKLASRR